MPGLSVDVGQVTLTEAEIIEFALRYDPQDMHTDPASIGSQRAGGLMASGWHTSVAVMRLVVERYLSPVASLPSPGIDELRWLKPVRPGDTLFVVATVTDRRISKSKPDRGLVHSRFVARDSAGSEVITVNAMGLMLRNPVLYVAR